MIIWAFVSLLCCKDHIENGSNVSIELQLVVNTIEKSTIVIRRDNLVVIREEQDSTSGKPFFSFIERYNPVLEEKSDDSAKLRRTFERITNSDSRFDSIFKAARSEPYLLYYENALNPQISYVDKGFDIKRFKTKFIDCIEALIHEDSKYFFCTCKGLDNDFYIYNKRREEIFKFHFEDNSAGIRGFEIFDLDGDSVPELIFFMNSPMVRLEKGVEIRVYKISGLYY